MSSETQRSANEIYDSPSTTEYLIGTHDDVFSCATMSRLQEDKEFGASIIKEIDMRYRDYVIQGDISSPVGVGPATPSTPISAPGGDPVPRGAKLNSSDFERHGFTTGCLNCEQIQVGSPTRKNHTESCRKRMEEELITTSEGQDRLERAKDRLDTGGRNRAS